MLSGTRIAEGPFVAVDIEATGSRPGTHEIIEIGAVRIENGEIVSRFERLIRPSSGIPHIIRALTGITDEMVAGAMPLRQVLEEFRDFAAGAALVAHNYRFDLGFLDYEAERAWGRPFQRPVIDTLALARRLLPGEHRHNLRRLADLYETHAVPDHRAGRDAAATAEVFLRMIPHLSSRGLRTAGEVAAFCGMAGQGELARRLPMATALPASPGVFVLRDDKGRVVHAGRAKDLRARVRSYFYGGSGPRASSFAAMTEAIQWIECASSLDCMLLESRIVARYRPPHSRLVMRGDRGPCVLTLTHDRVPGLKVAERPIGAAVGPFSSEGALEVVAGELRRTFRLRRCAERLTTDAARGECAHRVAGTCPSPCVHELDVAAYVRRAEAALATFEEGSESLRRALERRLEDAADCMHQEDGVETRDVLRAFERSRAAMRIVNQAVSQKDRVIVEAGGGRAAIHVVTHGYLAKTLRVSKGELASAAVLVRLQRVIDRVREAPRVDPLRLNRRQLCDVFLISTYLAQHEVAVHELPASAAELAGLVDPCLEASLLDVTRFGAA